MELSIFLPAELILLFVPVVSAQSVWLSSLRIAPSFQSPLSSSQPQPESQASAQSLYAVFAVGTEDREMGLRISPIFMKLHNLLYK